jgi:hypothetical protein
MSHSDHLISRDTVAYMGGKANIERLANAPLKEVILAGTSTDPKNANAIYHFRVSLVLDDEKVINLNMSPGRDIVTGVLLVTVLDKADIFSEEPTISFVAPAISGESKTVLDALKMVLERKRDRYNFNSEGNGCRHWSYSVLSDLANERFVASEEPGKFIAWEDTQHDALGNLSFPMPRIRGSFY